MEDVIKKTAEVLPLMNTMERLIENPEVKLKKNFIILLIFISFK